MLNTMSHMRIRGKAMGKRILIGSILVLVMLLLMPSIPAIQQRSVKEGIKQDLQEKLESINLEDIKDIKDLDGCLKHPLLYLSVHLVALRGWRGLIMLFISTKNMFSWEEPMEIIFPLLYERGRWLVVTALVWQEVWIDYAYTHGWNWGIPP